ncbi:MAG: iron-sulfur cluster assembly accessory protein [Nitrososphaerales archaeon]|nr:iron-sulfur cluster assembly accessory protein [Nitrososphaerales archaeon]
MRNYLLRAGKADSAIRVSVVRTHCMGGKGYGYNIEEDSVKADDTVVEGDGLKLLVDQESLRYLRGAHIDYEESVQGGGVVVRNPNAVGQCHCGRHDIFDREALAESEKC